MACASHLAMSRVMVSPTPSSRAHLRGCDRARLDGVSGTLFREAPAFAGTPSDGVYVAVADVNADGALDVITGIGDGRPLVRVFDVRAERLLMEFTADAIGTSDGVRVAAGDLNGDSYPEIITSAGPGGEPAVAVFDTVSTLLARFVAYPSTRSAVASTLPLVMSMGMALPTSSLVQAPEDTLRAHLGCTHAR